jgi:hypothetical protein
MEMVPVLNPLSAPQLPLFNSAKNNQIIVEIFKIIFMEINTDTLVFTRDVVDPSLKPPTAITIAVDTTYIFAQVGQAISQGVYAMDNRVDKGSTYEGMLGLSTVCVMGDGIGFYVTPINKESGDTVVITKIDISQGNVFTVNGQPHSFPTQAMAPSGSYWIGQAINSGSQNYAIQIMVTPAQTSLPTCYLWCNFTITALA